ncbi:hypothetical protein AK830_g7598 [Neonectria ditissima]|uniref:Pre-mRNA splicing factor CLF1 n=1 Tax=Neonectria ditissima TaxID=78410 RepID=A0A0P7BDH9_9HYPO|nr:hypothetical protein AK830_g7598 [Neonectria ditissima]
MSTPEPPTSLDGSCTTIYENTLYSYSPAGFLSIELKEDAEWKELKSGESVTGATCVGTPDGFWVVGGTGGSDAYYGLQKYTYSTGEWTTITPTRPEVTKNRQWHGTGYIKSDNTILIYAGSTDGVQAPSYETWTLSAAEPFVIDARAGSSYPVTNPIVMNWSDNEVAAIGGGSETVANSNIALFSVLNGWGFNGASLGTPLAKDSSSMQTIIMSGDDGSKSLYTFDLSTSPNEVNRFVVQDASGASITSAPAVSNTKRGLSVSDWPEYNSTLAPTDVRTNFAIAQSSDGTVVFSGGDADDSIAMFDASENSWVDSEAVFYGEEQQRLQSESSSTSSSKTKTSSSTKTKSTSTKTKSATETSDASSTFATSTTLSSTASGTFTLSDASASATSTDTAAVAGSSSDDSGLSSNVVLGVTLGSIIGFIAVLILLLLLLRRRRKAKQPQDESGHNRGFSSDEKAPMVFHNGPNPSSSPGHMLGHNSKMSQESYSSMAILMGRAGKPKMGLTRKPSHDTTRSSVSSLHKQLKATIGKPVLQEMKHPALQGQQTRGVAFDPNVAEPRPRQRPMEDDDGLRRSSGWNRYWSGGSALQILGFGGPKRITGVSDDQSSRYSEATQQRNPRVTQDSATVPPLNFDFRPEFNRVNSGSPVVEQYGKIPFQEGVAGKIERHSRVSSSGYSSGIPESVNEQWTSSNQAAKPWGADRATSSVYNPSMYFGNPLSPGIPPGQQPPSGVSHQPQLAMASTSSDMSWLNLGDRSRV